MEENKIEKEVKTKSKKHGPLYWIIVVMGVTFIIYTSIGIGEKIVKIKDTDVSTKNNSTEEKKEDTNEQQSNTTTENENSNKQETTNTTLTEDQKKKVATKLAIMFGDADYKYGDLIEDFITRTAVGVIFENKNDEATRNNLILTNIKPKKILVKDKSKYKSKINPEHLSNGLENDIVPVDEFVKLYKYVYGVEPQLVDASSCPSYYYESTTNNYFLVYECAYGTKDVANIIYIDEINSSDEKTINITTYVGAYYKNLSEKPTTYYSDYLRYDSNYKIATPTTTHKTITAENKTSFAKYNFVFEKANDGEYYFKNVVKAN